MKKFLFAVFMLSLLAASCNVDSKQVQPQPAQIQKPIPGLYTNSKYKFSFSYPTEWTIDAYDRTEAQAIITVKGDPIASMTLGVNTPPPSISPMEKIISDEQITINNIVMRKRVVGAADYQNIFYEFSNNGNSFVWFGAFRTTDTVNMEKYNTIVESFQLN